MLTIDSKIFSHLDLTPSFEGRSTPRTVAQSSGRRVRRYRQLLDLISEINYENPRFEIMYRGQGEDFRTRGTRRLGPRSSIYPTIFRQGNGGLLADQKIRVRRFEHLDEYSAQLEQKYKFGGRPRVRMFEEIRWAILQHYKKTPTPLVDVTESLLVAASFAYFHRQSNVGYLFAFGFPHRHGSISYHADDQLVLVRLASTCPPEARRAHYQQACFAGHFPLINYGSNGHNLANRLVAKFRLDFDNFWTDNFRPLPEAILYPPRDAIQKFVDSL